MFVLWAFFDIQKRFLDDVLYVKNVWWSFLSYKKFFVIQKVILWGRVRMNFVEKRFLVNKDAQEK